jgi:hypothetical protein
VNDQTDDGALHALDELRDQLDQTIRDLLAAKERLEQLARLRALGVSWSEIVSNEERPLVVETIATVLVELGETGSRFRREEALALQSEKMSITRIGQLFGVSRQRISTILRGPGTTGRKETRMPAGR